MITNMKKSCVDSFLSHGRLTRSRYQGGQGKIGSDRMERNMVEFEEF